MMKRLLLAVLALLSPALAFGAEPTPAQVQAFIMSHGFTPGASRYIDGRGSHVVHSVAVHRIGAGWFTVHVRESGEQPLSAADVRALVRAAGINPGAGREGHVLRAVAVGGGNGAFVLRVKVE